MASARTVSRVRACMGVCACLNGSPVGHREAGDAPVPRSVLPPPPSPWLSVTVRGHTSAGAPCSSPTTRVSGLSVGDGVRSLNIQKELGAETPALPVESCLLRRSEHHNGSRAPSIGGFPGMP
ncbi:unnamed protein product [Pleuronectes platessa]|uniref:Uncharacterized protein n=1 Tax=Pleuronectes platessa TaxID=8262 RepID=A0A9N7YXS0_PLEPL|nr:unnamed protein product [Pleuronectes platessa]